MLDEQVRGADLALFALLLLLELRRRIRGRGVVRRHVGFNFIWVCSCGWLPARFFGAGVEVVGEVFGIGVSDFPLGGETGVGEGLGGLGFSFEE